MPELLGKIYHGQDTNFAHLSETPGKTTMFSSILNKALAKE